MTIDDMFHTFPQLETKHLVLRRITPEDAPALFRILGDDEVTKHYDDTTFTDVAQAKAQIEAWENGYKARRCVRWGITRRGEGKMIGTCGFYGIHTWHMRGSIGYELARAHWRLGIMCEALGRLVEFGFNELGLNRIDAVVIPENEASIKLLEKLGFHNEGLLKEYENWGAKGFSDLYMLALTKGAWHGSSSG